MKKLYAISSGDYSDYKVACLFSSRYKARKFLEEWDIRGYWGDARIETFILDPDVPEDIGEKSWHVYEMSIDPRDDSVKIRNAWPDDWDTDLNAITKEIVDKHGQPPYWEYRVDVKAKNRKTALKVAQELYMKAKALNELPDINETLVREEEVSDWIEKKGGFAKVKITFMKGER
jgi:hypothetical protein